MAVIGPKLIQAGAILLVFALPMLADSAADARELISRVSTALTQGDASDAIAPFDKSLAKYEKLRNYFEGLTESFQLANEVDVTDEQDTEEGTKLTLNWNLTLTDMGTDHSEIRSGEINVRLVRQGRKWKIVEFSPIELFNPQRR